MKSKIFRRSPLLVLPLLLSIGSFSLWWQQVTAPVQSEGVVAPVTIEIPSGTSSDQVGDKLQQAGLIRSPLAWKLWVRWQSWRDPQGSLQAGSFSLSPQASLPTLATQIWEGKVQQTQITIPEGWSLTQMGEYFQQRGFFKSEAFLAATRKIPRQQFPWLPAGINSLEGFLYPDTYHLPRGAVTPELVVEVMLKQFQTVALPVYEKEQHQQPADLKLNLRQWVTLGSIVEKEAVVAKERPLIAGVFVNRLRKNIPLGSDPTVEYALGVRQTPDKTLTLAQVRTPSPYNTYINAGLPPGPIASPGVASLRSVLNPQATDYLYFVARYDGTHIFSRTLAEHEAAQDKIHDQREAQPPTP